MTMVIVSKSALKARMLEFFREVERTGEELVVTSDGVPVLKVVPFTETRSVDDAVGRRRVRRRAWSTHVDGRHRCPDGRRVARTVRRLVSSA